MSGESGATVRTEAGAEMQVVLFQASGLEFGADIRDVREIIKAGSYTALPGAEGSLKGVIDVRGEVLPLISLRSLAGAPPAAADKDTHVLIVDQRPPFGLIVDAVGEVRKLPPASIEPMPPALTSIARGGLYTGIAKLQDRMLILMDLKKALQGAPAPEPAAAPEAPAAPAAAAPCPLTELQLDALRELGNIGASHSATSLSQMVDSPIDITVPAIAMERIGGIPTIVGDVKVVGLLLEIREGDRSLGQLYNLFPEKSALNIVDRMMGQPLGTTAAIDEMGQSAIMEVANILTSAFCDAMADFLGITVLPSPPRFVCDMADSIVQNTLVEFSLVSDDVIVFRTDLLDRERNYEGYVILFPNPEMLERMLAILEAKAKP